MRSAHDSSAINERRAGGILQAAIVAVLLNAFFNGVGSAEEARTAAAATTHGAEA